MIIWKWTLAVTDIQTLQMPAGAQVIAVQVQHEAPQIWALVDEHAAKEPRRFVTIGTGNPFPWRLGRYVGTYQLHNGALVFHVFEIAD